MLKYSWLFRILVPFYSFDIFTAAEVKVMGWVYWPELLLLVAGVILVLFGIYYCNRKLISIPRRVKQLEDVVYKSEKQV